MNKMANVSIEQISHEKGSITEIKPIPTDAALWLIVTLSDGRKFRIMPNDDNTGIEIYGDGPISIVADASNNLSLFLLPRNSKG